jgi:Flp pilus assembly pilin Flp
MARPNDRSVWARLERTRRDENGAAAIEYALPIAGIAAAIIGMVFLLGADVAATFEGIHDKIAGQKKCAQARQNCGNY